MKKTLLFTLNLVLVMFSTAQDTSLNFNGTSDYIDLGNEAGNDLRTIEMWFKLNEPINPQLSDFSTLAAKEISSSNNTGEFSFSFQPSYVPNPGTLRFDIDGTQPYKSVYSDNNTWNADQWYHVAAVIDPVEGMMLFVDGVKQLSTHEYTAPTSSANRITTIGCWGDEFFRFFNGSIDNVLFSSQALYNSDFSPSCTSIPAITASTIGLWNLDEGSGTIANDAGPNGFIGQINGATWELSSKCANAMSFNGLSDYIDLGSEAGNNLRTIEMWFKLNEPINPQLSDFSTLAAKEISSSNNTGEFSFSFQPSYVPNPGTLRFDIDGTQPYKSVYSDNNTWNADQWYHVAAVIDPVEGMMLFVDGVKQLSTHEYTAPTSSANRITTIGCWGDKFFRFFNGTIDDVRFSTEAVYNSDFMPPCPDLTTNSSTKGLWNFNEGIGNQANDLSNNGFNGQIIGATRIFSAVCSNIVNTSNLQHLEDELLTVYPNPSNGIFNFRINAPILQGLVISLYNSLGQLVIKQKINNDLLAIRIDNETNGIYYYRVFNDHQLLDAGVLLKQ